jgi:flagellin-specific chaperone FliS
MTEDINVFVLREQYKNNPHFHKLVAEEAASKAETSGLYIAQRDLTLQYVKALEEAVQIISGLRTGLDDEMEAITKRADAFLDAYEAGNIPPREGGI